VAPVPADQIVAVAAADCLLFAPAVAAACTCRWLAWQALKCQPAAAAAQNAVKIGRLVLSLAHLPVLVPPALLLLLLLLLPAATPVQ
jgi:hypothetical protein